MQNQIMRTLIAVVALLTCSGAWAQPPASEGWRRLDFICNGVDADEQIQQWFYVNKNKGQSIYEEKYPASETVRSWHYSDDLNLQKNIYWGKGQLTGIDTIDRATGRMTRTDTLAKRTDRFDCELRPENKF